jgi:hypothetical protein
MEEYKARQTQQAEREHRASWDANGNGDAKQSNGEKGHDVGSPRGSSAKSGPANGSDHPPKDKDMDMDEDHAGAPGLEAVRVDATALDSTVASHDMITDNPSKDDDDENAEDVVEEAAEDTVIY